MQHLVSIIVPVYNVEKYIQRCIDSLSNQTYKNLEIILVNDGSTDKSVEICECAALKDQRVRVIHQHNSGSSVARNTGLDHATGKFIAFVDSDDHLQKEAIDEMLQLLLVNNLDVVEFERDNPNAPSSFDNKFKIETQEEAFIRTIKTSSFQVWKRLYKTSLISDMRFIPKIIHQDVFFVIDLLKRIDKIGHLNKPLYNYNRDNQSVIRSKYTLAKTKAGIMATEYILEHALNTKKITSLKKAYIVSYYTGHFFSLCRNKELDKEKRLRNYLRSEIRKNATWKTLNNRSWIAGYLPIFIVELIVKAHMKVSGTKYYN